MAIQIRPHPKVVQNTALTPQIRRETVLYIECHTMTNTPTYQYCHVCDYCIPRTNVHGGYRYRSSRRYASAASTDTSSFNITDTQTCLYCQVAIINGIIDNIADILLISLPSWQYLLMPMSLLPIRRYTYITVWVVLLTPVTISLTCRHRLTYIAVAVVLLVIYHRHADIGPTCSVMSVVLLILVTISVTILQYIYIAMSAVIISARRRYEVNLHCHVDIIYWLRRQHQHANILTLLYHVTCEPSYCWHILLTKNGILWNSGSDMRAASCVLRPASCVLRRRRLCLNNQVARPTVRRAQVSTRMSHLAVHHLAGRRTQYAGRRVQLAGQKYYFIFNLARPDQDPHSEIVIRPDQDP